MAHTLATAILQFWHSVELSQDKDNPNNDSHVDNSALFVSGNTKWVESVKDKIEEPIVAQVVTFAYLLHAADAKDMLF